MAFIAVSALSENPVYRAEHLMQCGSWEVVFYKSGFAHEAFNNTCGEDPLSFSKLHRVSAQHLKAVEKALSETRFVELPESLEPLTYITDDDMYVIQVLTSDKKKKVSAIGMQRAANRDQAARFEQVWKTINSIIHEPVSK